MNKSKNKNTIQLVTSFDTVTGVSTIEVAYGENVPMPSMFEVVGLLQCSIINMLNDNKVGRESLN